MGTYAAGLELVELLEAAGVSATADVRNAVPPCVLVTPPVRRYDLNVGYSLEWRVYALAPGAGNADAWLALDELLDELEAVIDLERAEPGSYTIPTADGALSVPAYIITTTGAR